MSHIDGAAVASALRLQADVIVVGSGPGGAAAAAEASAHGARVLLLEAGPWLAAADFAEGAFSAMAQSYVAMSASVVVGPAPMALVQGRMVGGSSPINGAICWRLPRDVYDGWLAADPALADGLPWAVLEADTDALEARLHVGPTPAALAGPKAARMAIGADALGLAHRPIRRNVRGCRGSGRCIQGCPHGAKQSVDQTLIADAMARGATVVSGAEALKLRLERRGGRDVAVGVHARLKGGGTLEARADRAVVLAAGAVHTPALLLASGLDGPAVGHGFRCHPGVSMAGHFAEPIRNWEGATQGHEVTGLRHEGLKFETLGFGIGVQAARLDGVGAELAAGLDDLAHLAEWGCALRAEGVGRVRRIFGRPLVFWRPTPRDVSALRRGLRFMGEMMLAAGAEWVSLGVRGAPARVSDVAALRAFEVEGPTAPSAFRGAITHLFGGACLGGDPQTSVLRPDFRHHRVEGLYVADAAAFPGSTGVNPQLAILTLGTLAGRRALGLAADAHAAPTPGGSA